MKILITIPFIFLFALGTQAQNCVEIQECNEKLSQASQMVNKLLDVKRADEAVIEAKNREIEAVKNLVEVQKAISAEKDKLIEIYRKAVCDKTSFFFGIISVKRCRL
jgi:hypothetical protein